MERCVDERAVLMEREAERLLADAHLAPDPRDAARLLFEAFLALSRTTDGSALLPIVERMGMLRAASPSPEVEYLFHSLTGVVHVRARLPGGVDHLDTALRLFDEYALFDDALFLECAILSTLTLIRPHETRAKFSAHVDRLDLEPVRRARLVAMIGLGDAWAGNLVRGQAEMLEARQLAILAERLDVQAEVTSWLIKCEALRGDLTASAEHLEEARELAARTGSSWVAGHITEGAAALAFARGDIDAWVGLLEFMVGAAIGGDSGLVFEYRWELATQLVMTGRADDARALLRGVPDPPSAWPGGPAMAAWRAWILAPDDPAAIAGLDASLSLLTRPAERLPRARLSWLLGRQHARAGRRAAAVRLLEAACSGYATIGAAGMLALAVRDLHDVAPPAEPGHRPRTPQAFLGASPGEQPLTGSEVRVAVAVADGLSNRETAARLFVSVKTIEFHLGNVYRKLGVRNRTELARRRGQLG
jgi:DNA-binding CsgD family transcriptional regulator